MPVRRSPAISISVQSPSQLALTGARLCLASDISPREAARKLGDVVSHQSIRVARRLLLTADAATIDAIESGAASVNRIGTTRTAGAVGLPLDVYDRLRALSQRSGVPMRTITTRALAAFFDLAERTGGVP